MQLRSPDLATPADHAACRALLRHGSRSFLAASMLLPRRVRDPAVSLYAFCRVADDAIDQSADPAEALVLLRQRLALAYDGRPLAIPADRALAETVARFRIPRALPDALLEGFAWDAESRRYEDISALTAYAVRVAGTVGAMMALLMGARAPEVVSRACDLGVAMQLSNIARDVGEDARNGRLYLPLQWLRAEGIDPEAWLLRPAYDPAIGRVVRRLLAVADGLYGRAGGGIARLDPACRPGISAARHLYAEIGREVERRGLDSVTARAVVSPWRKTRVIARSLADAASRPGWRPAEQLPEARFLIDAVEAAPAPPPLLVPANRWNLQERATWVIDLFHRLERQQLGR